MAEGTYEYECMRAELLGIEQPNQEEFEKARAARLKQEQEEQEAAEAALLAAEEEPLKATGGKMDELNSILSSTQQKLNRFKQTACGSLSNIFNKGSVDLSEAPSTSATASRRNTTASGGGGGIGNADTVEIADHNADNHTKFPVNENPHDIQPIIPTEKIRSAKLDIQKKMTSHLDALDSLISKSEAAELSMSQQTQQMRKMAK